MENKQKALEMAAAMQQKEKSDSLLWCVAEDLKATIQSMNEEEAKVIVADLEAGTHDLKTCEKAIHDYHSLCRRHYRQPCKSAGTGSRKRR